MDTKQKIIEKALPIFNTKGYKNTSLRDITAATGLTKGAIYGNFKDKDEVAAAAFDLAVLTVMSELNAKIKEAKTAPAKLYAIIQFYENYILNPVVPGGCPLMNCAVEADDTNPVLRLKVVRFIQQIRASLQKIINRGIVEKQFKKEINAEQFAELFFASLQGGVMIGRSEGDKASYTLISEMLKEKINQYTI
jgi:AcrR family transcriptional regulator